ncbi:hypothetical protein Glove_296g33 [Diversispora epigaea]|uniref:Uncharacterized protein n=1 Tax=Diversispora epigaea TaxID=1348612 RepID=A0A397HZ07_9GLOM|nr:hypothetical protein Glove_296g33 [Diversispora epigaea]
MGHFHEIGDILPQLRIKFCCLGMAISTSHSRQSQQPGYCCQAGVLFKELGFDDNSIVNQLLDGVYFGPFYISGDKLRIFFDGFALFGLKDDYTKKILESRELPTCQPTDWTNDNIMNVLYSYYLKKCTLANINWQKNYGNVVISSKNLS